MIFEILFPFGLWVFEPGWLLDHSQIGGFKQAELELELLSAVWGAAHKSASLVLGPVRVVTGAPRRIYPARSGLMPYVL